MRFGTPHAIERPEPAGIPHRDFPAQMIPLGRVGDVADIARAAVFLASDEAKWISGATLRVDGGIVVQ